MKIKKEITFICTDHVEELCCLPIAEEAESRGYKVKFTTNKYEKCEIGFYVSHMNFPKNSKFSVVMLHDLGQQHTHWPNIWKNEFWNQYDVGLLPNMEWVGMYKESSCFDFVRPKKGAYHVGWTKSDSILNKNFEKECEDIINKYKIDKTKKTILYAPSWEWDNRQLEIIDAVKTLNVNLIIKQFPFTLETFPEQFRIINEMHEKSKNIPNVYILDSKINIFNAIELADILVSEESSTLNEAMLMGKPVISVTDWLIPDDEITRKPDFPYSFAIHTEKKYLKEIISDILNNKEYEIKIKKYRDETFPNLGSASKNVLDVLDSLLFNKESKLNKVEEKPLVKTPKQLKKSVNKRKFEMLKTIIKDKIIFKNVILSKLFYTYKNQKKIR